MLTFGQIKSNRIQFKEITLKLMWIRILSFKTFKTVALLLNDSSQLIWRWFYFKWTHLIKGLSIFPFRLFKDKVYVVFFISMNSDQKTLAKAMDCRTQRRYIYSMFVVLLPQHFSSRKIKLRLYVTEFGDPTNKKLCVFFSWLNLHSTTKAPDCIFYGCSCLK